MMPTVLPVTCVPSNCTGCHPVHFPARRSARLLPTAAPSSGSAPWRYPPSHPSPRPACWSPRFPPPGPPPRRYGCTTRRNSQQPGARGGQIGKDICPIQVAQRRQDQVIVPKRGPQFPGVIGSVRSRITTSNRSATASSPGPAGGVSARDASEHPPAQGHLVPGPSSTTSPSASGTPGPEPRSSPGRSGGGGKFTTATTCRPISPSQV